jgi:hypothetical protein
MSEKIHVSKLKHFNFILPTVGNMFFLKKGEKENILD